MIEIKCETVGEKRKVSVYDGTSLIWMVESPLSGKGSDLKQDVALIIYTRNQLRERQAKVDKAILAKLTELGVNTALDPFVQAIKRQIDVAKLKEMEDTAHDKEG